MVLSNPFFSVEDDAEDDDDVPEVFVPLNPKSWSGGSDLGGWRSVDSALPGTSIRLGEDKDDEEKVLSRSEEDLLPPVPPRVLLVDGLLGEVVHESE